MYGHYNAVAKLPSSFFGLFGMYYSLQYLSLADATVLSFLAPLSAAIGGYIVLKEPYSKREAFAASSCNHPILVSF